MRWNLLYPAAEQTLAFAADELRDYLERMAPELAIAQNGAQGEGVPVHLRVGEPGELDLPEDADPALDDCYSVEIGPEGGQLVGSNPRSVLLAVYAYLTRLGCRFLRPGRRYEHVPKVEDGALAQAFQKAASLRHRGICIEGADAIENVLDTIDWLPKVGYNSFFIQFRIPYFFLENWYRHTGNPCMEAGEFNMALALRYTDEMIAAIKRRGLLEHRAGHGWTGEAIGYPGLGWQRSAQQPREEVRPLLAQVDGKRTFWNGIPLNTNLCYSNPAVIERVSEEIACYARDNPDVDYLHVWLADTYNNICECEACQKEHPTDQYIRLLNAADEKLRRMGLHTRIVFLLYQELLWPPQKERFNHPERFILMFAPITRTFNASYPAMEGLPPIPEYRRNRIILPTSLQENLAYYAAWRKAFSGDSFVYDYPLTRAHYGDLGYVGISRIISGDIKQLAPMGFGGYMSCQQIRAALPNALPNYVMGLTLMDTDQAFEPLARDYFAHAYGEQGEAVYAYLSTLSALSDCDYLMGIGPRENAQVRENMAACLEKIDAFAPVIERNMACQTGLRLDFWQHLSYHADYARALARTLMDLAAGDTRQMETDWGKWRELICKNEIDYQGCLDVYRISEITSKYTGFPRVESIDLF
ncbi:Uncharacterised protein [uncultured Clostridium sp.]|nr:Uncharacterised protein [uncultured Clostridium sp.]